MAENTAIEWADDTFNPWEGCQATGSPACDNCYAEARNARFNGGVAVNWGPHAPRRLTSDANWKKPLTWEKEQSARVRQAINDNAPMPPPRFVFCASLADVFDNAVPTEWRTRLFTLIRSTPHLTWLLLTKRPGNIGRLFCEAEGINDAVAAAYWPRNAAIGCTVVNQAEADRDVPALLLAKAMLNAPFAFLSMEPLMGMVDLTRISTLRFPGAEVLNALTGVLSGMFGDTCGIRLPALGWVITGFESGRKARPGHPDWARTIRDQCAEASIPYLHKQNGEWAACAGNDGYWPVEAKGHVRLTFEGALAEEGWPMQRVGKKHAGRLLDGEEHNARPEVAHG